MICPPVISQFAVLARTREIVLGELKALRGLCDVSPSEGAIYLFLRLHTDVHLMTVVERLVKEHGVAALPGTDFGLADGCCLRVSYGGLPQAMAAAGVGRLVRGVKATMGG